MLVAITWEGNAWWCSGQCSNSRFGSGSVNFLSRTESSYGRRRGSDRLDHKRGKTCQGVPCIALGHYDSSITKGLVSPLLTGVRHAWERFGVAPWRALTPTLVPTCVRRVLRTHLSLECRRPLRSRMRDPCSIRELAHNSQGGVSGCYGSTPTTLGPVRQVAPCLVDTHRWYKPVCAHAGQLEPPPLAPLYGVRALVRGGNPPRS